VVFTYFLRHGLSKKSVHLLSSSWAVQEICLHVVGCFPFRQEKRLGATQAFTILLQLPKWVGMGFLAQAQLVKPRRIKRQQKSLL